MSKSDLRDVTYGLIDKAEEQEHEKEEVNQAQVEMGEKSFERDENNQTVTQEQEKAFREKDEQIYNAASVAGEKDVKINELLDSKEALRDALNDAKEHSKNISEKA
eukprot:6707524-Karenia_brevis.AAC.1